MEKYLDTFFTCPCFFNPVLSFVCSLEQKSCNLSFQKQEMENSGNYLITGAGRGVGLATVKYLLENHSGINVYAVSRNTGNLSALSSGRLKIIQADITDEIEKISAAIGKTPLQGILNNAGLLIKKDFRELTGEDFDQLYRTNVLAPFNIVKALLDNLAAGSHVVNIGSMGGTENTLKFPGMIFYSSSKAALQCLSQCLSVELQEQKVTVNCLSMGSVDTEMVRMAFPGFKAPIGSGQMAEFFGWFLLNGHRFFSGQILPLALTIP